MSAVLLKGCEAIVTSASEPGLWGQDILCENGAITAIGSDLSRNAPESV